MQIIEINEADLSRIQALYAEIERTKLHVEALEYNLKSLLQARYAVDLDKETWAIDLQRGTLKRDDSMKAMLDKIEQEEASNSEILEEHEDF